MEEKVLESDECDGFALVSQLNSLREEFLKVKVNFEKQLEDLKVKFNSQLKVKDVNIKKLQTRNDMLEMRIGVAECLIKENCSLIDDAEQYYRRHSLRINGIAPKYNENSDDVLQSVSNEIKRLNLNIAEVEIDRAHRSGAPYTDHAGARHQGVLAKFTSWDARNKFYKARKHSNFYLKADLTKQKDEALRYARHKINDDSEVSDLVDYVYVDANCNLMACTSTRRFLKFNSRYDFDLLVCYVDNTSKASQEAYDECEVQFQQLCSGE